MAYQVLINEFILSDSRISWKAKGIWHCAVSKKEDLRRLVKESKDGRDSLSAGLKELEKFGYLKRPKIKDENGKLHDLEWVFYEIPLPIKHEE